MLVVISILVAIFLIAAPAVSSVIQANRLTAAGGQVLSLLALAQQMALVEGRPVEIRFTQYTRVGSSDPYYQTITLSRYYSPGEIGPDGRMVPTSAISVLAADPVVLPNGIIISSQISISNIIGNNFTTVSAQGGGGGGNVATLENYSGGSLTPYNWGSTDSAQSPQNYCSVIIRPNGTSLPDPTQTWYFTLIDETKATQPDISTINNFYTIAIDPINGHATSYRP